jgi:membrane protein implicated in regulation of membrane protease activity
LVRRVVWVAVAALTRWLWRRFARRRQARQARQPA